MRGRLIVATIVQVLAVLFSFMVWIDPLEGGVALIAVIALAAVAWLIGRVRIPAMTWIPSIVTLLIGIVEIAIVLSAVPSGGAPTDDTVPAPSTRVPEIFWVFLWLWRFGAVVVVVGMIVYLVAIVRAMKPRSS